MELPAQKFREIVLQLIFSFDMGGEMGDDLIFFIMRELAVSKKNVKTALAKAQAIWKMHEELDQVIAKQSLNYSIDRIKSVEKNVLRMAFYDLLIEKEQSIKIIISEAHRLTRKFSAIEGAAFVNAVLDSIHAEQTSISPSEREAAI